MFPQICVYVFQAFSLFGTTFADDVIPERLTSLCDKYGMEASDLCDEWMTWTKADSTLVEYQPLEKMIQDFEKRKQIQAAAAAAAAQKTPKLQARKRYAYVTL